ncbi:hypothetical protein [Curtobacterium sp. MCBA15_001]|uniref:hypothetical protein n=1 Tax=Curtobacterium sp. MCBA15_001 TaxID=1898731 RepID=UPI0011133200|nr:hypothetical protein [Curtobacterium sp. MCBA15_001]
MNVWKDGGHQIAGARKSFTVVAGQYLRIRMNYLQQTGTARLARQIRNGKAQLKRYIKALNKAYPTGKRWTGSLITYPPYKKQ